MKRGRAIPCAPSSSAPSPSAATGGALERTSRTPPIHPRPRPEDDPNLSPEQRALLARVQALTTPEALELLTLYQEIENPEHRASVRKLARTLAAISRERQQRRKF